MNNRREFLKMFAAAAATPLAASAAETIAKPDAVSGASESLRKAVNAGLYPVSKPQLGRPLKGIGDIDLSAPGALGKSTYNCGEVMTASHWGAGYVDVRGGKIQGIEPLEIDQSPSLQLDSYVKMPYNGSRIKYPMVRKSFLEKGYRAGGEGRGIEPFVRVSWDEAITLCADEIKRVATEYGPEAIYGASNGWWSAGSLNSSQTLLWRMLNVCAGGFVNYYGEYSTACIMTILPYVIGSQGISSQMTAWDPIIEKCGLVVIWGADPTVTNDIDWPTTAHQDFDGFTRLKKSGIPVVVVNPLKPDTAEFLGPNVEWIAPRPGTDVAMMAAMCWELEKSGKADHAFLDKYTSGYDKFRDYLSGKADGVEKTAEWAEKISTVPAQVIRKLAFAMREKNSMLMGGWGIQRAQYGEQVHWMMVALASVCGHIGEPGGGFGFSYHNANGGAPTSVAPTLPVIGDLPPGVKAGIGKNGKPIPSIPVARYAEMFMNPGKEFDYNGQKIIYPDIKLVCWAGGNPFGQQEQLNQLVEAWKRPQTCILSEILWTSSARRADIILPSCTSLERNDITSIGSLTNTGFVAMQKAIEPQWESLTDYEMFRRICAKFGPEKERQFTEGLDEMGWIKRFYNEAKDQGKSSGIEMPDFDEFWKSGVLLFPVTEAAKQYNYFGDFRADPEKNKLQTETGKIVLYSPKIESYHYPDCPPTPTWLEPTEWLGGKTAKEYPFALITCASRYRLHTQLDSTQSHEYVDVDDREPVWIHPDSATKLGIEQNDIVEVESRFGKLLAAAQLTKRVRPDVVVIHHGAWFCPKDPKEKDSLDIHGCANAITGDAISSRLSDGNVANSWLVKVRKYEGELPRVYCWEPPKMETRKKEHKFRI